MRGRLNVKNFCLRKIRKIRHRKGYGVHSPFAYNLITKVIEEKSGYYAYQQIEGLHRTLHDKQSLNKRRYRLLFRLTNRFKPQTIIEAGSEGGYSTLYLQKGCPTAQHFCIEPDPIKRAAAEQLLMRLPGKVTYINASIADGLSFLSEKGVQPHFIYLHPLADARQYEAAFAQIAPLLNETCILVVDGIRQSKEILHCWEAWARNEKIRVTFDLYTLAIASCNPKLNRQKYKVAF